MKCFAYEKENICCNICGHDEYEVVSSSDRYNMGLRTVACVRCSCLYTNPRPRPEFYSDFYAHHYRHYYEGVDEPNQEYIREKRFDVKAKRTVDFLAEFLPTSGSVLDIGCSEGSILHEIGIRAPGCVLKGVEPNPVFAEFASEYSGADVEVGFAESKSLQDGSFDLAIACHVLEHSLNPTAMLLRVHSLLRSDGVLFLEVPNILHRKLCRNSFHIAHTYYFNIYCLKALLSKVGFIIRKFDYKRRGLFKGLGIRIVAQRAQVSKLEIPDQEIVSSVLYLVKKTVNAGLFHKLTNRLVTSVRGVGYAAS